MLSDYETKGRIIRIDQEQWFLYYDGTCKKVDNEILKNILLGFRQCKGMGSYEHTWQENRNMSIMDVHGETLLYFDSISIVVFDASVFNPIIAQGNPLNYISAAEYAELHNCSVSRIKKLCIQQRIVGSIKISGKWFIYKYSDYPADNRRYNKRRVKELMNPKK